MCFSRSNTILTICQEWLVQLMWNEKEVHWLDTGYNIWPWPLTSLMTLTLDVSRSNFEIAISPELLVWLMWNYGKWVNIILGRSYDLALWPDPWPWPWSFKVRVWNSLSQEWGGRLTMNEKDVSHPFMTIILTCVTMVRWADVPDSGRGDFRRRRAVDISSWLGAYTK